MQKKRFFRDASAPSSAAAGRHHVISLPDHPSLPPALGAGPTSNLRPKRRRHLSKILNTITRCAALLFLVATPLFGAVRQVRSIGLTVNNLNRELMFYTNTLPFKVVSIEDAAGPREDAFLGLHNVKLRTATLRLGDENLTLTEHLTNKGRPIPPDSRSFDHWFQHIAIVVSDMDKAYARLQNHKVKHISSAPQTLPEWNINAGGIKAFYFRDPEDHVLEIICFPKEKGDPKWQTDPQRLFLGIDHTAIVVSDTDSSLAFYRDTLGMSEVGVSENYGVEQEHLNQVFGARLHITALRATKGPGIESLQYLTPPGGRPFPAASQASDLIFWKTPLNVDQLDSV